MKILFKYPTRSRPELFKRGAESIINNCESEDYHILVSVDADDAPMDRQSYEYKNTTIICGTSKSKVDAVNRDVNNFDYPWDIVVCMSDDMVFNVKGFDNIIRNSFERNILSSPPGEVIYKYNMNTCLHFPDGNRNDLITMSIMGKDYYNRFNYIYHPDYKSLYCDNEATEVAKILGCYKYVDKQIFEHKHPAYGKAVFDQQYQHTESFNQLDKETYLRRKEINFGL